MTSGADVIRYGSTFQDALSHSGIGDRNHGWRPILDTLGRALYALDPDIKFYQIKEKFGVLRIYSTALMDSDADRLISWAEHATSHTCDVTGKPGKLRTKKVGGGYAWMRTLSYDKARELGYVVPEDRYEESTWY